MKRSRVRTSTTFQCRALSHFDYNTTVFKWKNLNVKKMLIGHTCAIREVLEETGFDIGSRIDPNDYLETVVNDQVTKKQIKYIEPWTVLKKDIRELNF